VNWKKPIITVTIVYMLLFAVVGCNNTGSSVVVSTTGTTTQPAVAGDDEENLIPSGGAGFSENGSLPFRSSDNGTMPGPPGGDFGQRQVMPDIDWAAAAAALGITEDVLKEAVGDLSAGMPDFAAIGEKLGVTEQQLMEALGFTGGNIAPPGELPQFKKEGSATP